MRYVFWSMSDRGSNGHYETYASPDEAIRAAKETWGAMTEKEQHTYYIDSPGSFFLACVVDDDDEILETLWDATAERLYEIDRYADGHDVFCSDFWGDTDPDTISKYNENGIPESELKEVWNAWEIEQPFYDWLDEHFREI